MPLVFQQVIYSQSPLKAGFSTITKGLAQKYPSTLFSSGEFAEREFAYHQESASDNSLCMHK